MNLTRQPVPQKSGRPARDPARLARVKQLPCVICGAGCPDCRDTGIISRPYIAGVVSTMTACTCDAGRAFLAEWDRQSAALRARQMNAELPNTTHNMLKLKGMI